MSKLGVNIDHVATLRQARGEHDPEPVYAAVQAQDAGADNITVHLREDRRHIQDRDVEMIREMVVIPLNLEMALSDELLLIALKIKPNRITLVPEKRAELTTEGGLDVILHQSRIKNFVNQCNTEKITVSIFVDPNPTQIQAIINTGATMIELHTGYYANTRGEQQKAECERLKTAAKLARDFGLQVSAGHGLTYHNVKTIVQISDIEELNIGHNIIARALFVGLTQAVKEMKLLTSITQR